MVNSDVKQCNGSADSEKIIEVIPKTLEFVKSLGLNESEFLILWRFVNDVMVSCR